MLLLSVIFLILGTVSILDVIKCPLNVRLLILTAVGLILALAAGLRYGDRDYFAYLDIYDSVSVLFTDFDTSQVHGEPGYLFLNQLLKTLGIGPTGVFIVMAFSSVALALNFFRKYTPFFLIAALLYFSHVYLLRDMMQIRAGLAASISLYALRYIDERRIWRFSVIVGLASTMHSGVLLLFLAYITYPYYRKHPSFVKYIIPSGFFIGLILKANLIEFIITTFFNIPAVAIYLADPEYFTSLGLFNIVLLKNIILILFLFYYKDELIKNVPYFEVYVLCLGLGIFWLSAFNNFAILAARLATYFANVEHILLPSLFFTKINKFLLWGIVVVYCLIMFVSKFEIFDHLSFLFLP
jgi:hypothetical protein